MQTQLTLILVNTQPLVAKELTLIENVVVPVLTMLRETENLMKLDS